MSYDSEKSAAEIEREISADRERIGEKLNAIQEKLTPGQLMDEALGFLKNSGGAEYIGNLGQTAKANPIPLALMGVSLSWLMAGGSSTTSSTTTTVRTDRSTRDVAEYPLATVSGSVRRMGPVRSENGGNYSHFEDTTGKRFRALTDEAGNRAGHFMDDAGATFRGFADATGQRISDFRDETGNMLSDASGWASDTWEAAKDKLSSFGETLSNMGGSIGSTSSSAFGSIQDQSGRLNDMILRTFRDQPLVGGALAFAAGAAIGAALPHTQREDQLMGEAADSIKDDLSDRASDLMDKGKDVARDVYDKAVAVAADVHDTARDRIIEETKPLHETAGTQQRPQGGLGANV